MDHPDAEAAGDIAKQVREACALIARAEVLLELAQRLLADSDERMTLLAHRRSGMH